MRRVLADVRHRHLVRAPRALDLDAVDLARARPALRRAEHDHRPRGRARSTPSSRAARWIAAIPSSASSSAAAKRWCASACGRVEPDLDEHRPVAVALEELDELLLRDPRQHRRVRDLVAVQVEDRQHRAVDLARSGTCSSASSPRAGPSRPRRRRRRTRRRAPGCRTPRRRRARARSRARRPRGSSPVSPARRGSGSRPGRRTGGRARAGPPRPGRCSGRPRSRCRRGRRPRRGRGRRGRGR